MRLGDVIAVALVLALLVGLLVAGLWIAGIVVALLAEDWQT